MNPVPTSPLEDGLIRCTMGDVIDPDSCHFKLQRKNITSEYNGEVKCVNIMVK